MRVWQPMFKCILTDMGAQVASGQGGVCADFELNAMECIEYYGAKQGITACKDWYDDYMECQSGAKQWLRLRAMFKAKELGTRHTKSHLNIMPTWSLGTTRNFLTRRVPCKFRFSFFRKIRSCDSHILDILVSLL